MSIHHEIDFMCTVQKVFEALTDAGRFGEFSKSPAEIDLTLGGALQCFEGMITGRLIELVPNERLVQAWRVANWDEGVYSIAKFDLQAVNDTETKLIFDHTGLPEEHRPHLDQGWHNKYWDPMKALLEG